MTRLVRPLAALVLLCSAAPVLAQNPTPPAGARPAGPGGPQQGGGTIRGAVVDEAGAPVARASVSVWSAADSSLVTGAVAGPNGQFRVEGLRPGRYYVKASSLGRRTTSSDVLALSPQAPVADAGTIRLAAGAVQLDAIEVTAERATAGFSADRNTYRAADLQATGGTATDVLRNVPALEVDGDGKVSLRGNENVAVQINGRPVPMRGEQLANYLQQ
ncbi:MAG TPA: carboxypeptidase-like regulatory domain-containing protein, partial [Longimicrobium sp.]|nr:carboxypeptidase-like regulatory domain-containing protein [Longimicrobium sp.]